MATSSERSKPLTKYANDTNGNIDVERYLRVQTLYDELNSWRKVAKATGLVHPSDYDFYKRTQKRLLEHQNRSALERLSELEAKVKDGELSDIDLDESEEEETPLDIYLVDYGKLPPINYVSPLSHDEWAAYYGEYDWDAGYLTEVRSQIWDMLKVLLLIGRFHGKTSVMICLFCRWILEVRAPIIVFSNPAKKGDIFREVYRILTSDRVRKDYGDVIATARENKGDIFLVPQLRGSFADPNFVINGSLSKSIGRHASSYVNEMGEEVGGWLHLEDCWQEVKVSKEAEDRTLHWLDRTIRYMRGLKTKFTMTGTRKDIDDAYDYAMKKHHFPVFHLKSMEIVSGRIPNLDEVVVDHEREVLTEWEDVGVYKILNCPEFPIERLLYEFIFHYESAEAELNNNPLPLKGAYFDGDHWDEIEDPIEFYPKYIQVDPGFGTSDSASESAILVLGIHRYSILVVTSVIDRLDTPEKANEVIELHSTYDPLQTLVEDSFKQMSTRYDVDHRLLQLKGLRMFEQKKVEKNQRIAAMKSAFRRGEIKFLSTCNNLTKIKQEYLTFDIHKKGDWNALDALSTGYEMLHPFMRKPHRMEGQKVKIGSRGGRW